MFGLFGRKKIPASETERVALVRRLLKMRAEHSPKARAFLKSMELDVDEFEDSMVMMSVESGIMRIVEQYLTGVESGARDEEVLPFLNQTHALLFSKVGQRLPIMQPPFTLLRYAHHFVEHTNRDGMPIDESFIPIAVDEIYAFYGRRQKRG